MIKMDNEEQFGGEDSRSRRTPRVNRLGRKILLGYNHNGLSPDDVPVGFFRHVDQTSGVLWEVATGCKQHGHQRRWKSFLRLYDQRLLDYVELQDGYMIYMP